MKKLSFAKNHEFYLAALFILILDQISKIIILKYLEFDTEYIMNKYLSLHFIFNESYIMLNQDVTSMGLTNKTYFSIIYVVFAMLLCFGIYWVTKQKPFQDKTWEIEVTKTGLFLIFGAILGNAFDRAFRTEGVIDFIRLNISKELIPIVNVADVVIYIGELLIFIGFTVIIIKKILEKLKTKYLSID